MAVEVTVVVPTYNSGRHIEPLVESMLRQTLPRSRFEVLFVDDGSTDGTPDHLDALVAAHDHFRLTRVPRSGWPGKPRNVGVEQANGAYVQFVDHDDRLAPQALERLSGMGRRNGSDIVIGKVASNFRSRGVPYGLMSRTRERCTVWDAPLIDSLTPHKMFRTAFLREHGITHPEGPWILEDQLFMVRSYLKASVVSVLGDYVCYTYWAREDAENAGTSPMDPRWYYGNLREVMATVVAGTGPGPERDRLLRRFYRVEMLSRVGVPPRGLPADPPFRDDPYEAVRDLAMEFMTNGVHQGLAAVPRTRSVLLREDRREDLTEFTRRQSDLVARCSVERPLWNRDRFKASFTARFAGDPGGSGLLLARRGERYFLAPALTDGVLSEPVEVTDELKSFKADVLLRHTESAHVWVMPRETSLALEEEPAPRTTRETPEAGGGTPDSGGVGTPDGSGVGTADSGGVGTADGSRDATADGSGEGADGTAVLVRPVVRGSFAVDPLRAAGGAPLAEGVWEVRIRLMGAGFDRYARLGGSTAADEVDLPAPEILGGHEITPVLSGDGLALTVRASDAAPRPRPPKVSVVLPTAGADPEAVGATLASLTAQTLPARDVEVIPVAHTPPGTEPRDAGADAATGAYVMFMEPGDRLTEDALERMYAYGVEHDADIVAGKPAAKDRPVPRELFVRDRPRATLARDPLADSLTPDKLFDRAFLAGHGLRFTEGRPLAGQAFTAEATLRAGRTAVLGSHVCYRYGPPRQGQAPVPPGVFYGALSGLLEMTDRLTGPGAARDRLHRRWLRVEILDRLSGKRLLDLDDDARRELFHEIRKVVVDGISPTAVAGLPAARRLAVGLIVDDRPEDLLALTRWESSIGCRARLDALSWRDDGRLRIGFTAEPLAAEGPVGLTTTDDGAPALAPDGLSPALRERFAREPLTGAAAPGKATAVLVLRERAGGAEHRLPTEITVRREGGALGVTGTASLDPATAVDGTPLTDGVWDLYVRLTALGWTKNARLGGVRGPGVPERLTPVPHPAAPDRRITPYWTDPRADLSLRVSVARPPEPGKPGLLRRAGRRLRRP
ncbi:glycosyltransferase [Streptomyces sp. NPDC002018]|uniref:glycosyltransferase n=1 Tax=Streptomyces sp. NPDC002018 TaxID=3364629 RepID=UPI0036C72243